MDLVELLDPQPGERILDAGCGTGQLTARICASGATVTGIDISPLMIEAARAACPAATFLLADITTFEASEPFDAVFSQGVLHWVRPPEAAARRIRAALKPGGRFVAELGCHPSVPAPPSCYLPALAEYSALLEDAGLTVTSAASLPGPRLRIAARTNHF